MTTQRNGDGPRLMLVRHGQTNANIIRALDTRPPGSPLNVAGLEQAARAADRLAGEPVIAVYASVAVRAQQTAAPIAARHGLAVEVVEDIQEVSCGDFEGRADHDARVAFEKVYRGWTLGELEGRMPGGESATEVTERFLRAVGALWRRHADQRDGVVVVVSHGGAMQISARAMVEDYRVPRYVPNTGRVVLVPHIRPDGDVPSRWRLERWDTAEDVGVPLPSGDVTGGAHEPDAAAE